jgi:dUTP pyrophosphatase
VNVELKILDPRLPGWGFPNRGSRLAAGLDLHACLDGPLVLTASCETNSIEYIFAPSRPDAGLSPDKFKAATKPSDLSCVCCG